ncbi:glycosyltransferase [Rufibacter tibetensis]|uniref:Glycosyltransferase subfamily 4-like N-terminal domain-containing protein n=1 Tax=Rufibacter tibetensis TaxID=512763 RepID=A0A0P0CQT1_9BACT|nr:glycosyltransferase [Rufibacter tibetensis]ALI99764.1 hypothetical protein DC20_13260 [Rufibacter tibetensis]
MKTILLLIPNLGYGGAQRVFHDHSTELSKKYKVYDCVFNKDDGVAYPTSNELIDMQVPGGGNIFLKIYYFWLRIHRLKKIKKHYKIDVCISHLEGADYVNVLSKVGEKNVICVHGSKLHDKDISGPVGWIRKKIFMPILYKIPDKIVTVSRDINQELIMGFGVDAGKVITINNFFDLEKIHASASMPLEDAYLPIFKEGKVLINSGRLVAQKNQLPLLPVMASLRKKGFNCKLVIVGDGDLRETLIQKGREMGLRIYDTCSGVALSEDYDVYFLGFHDNPFKFISKANVFVFPSSWEGFPMALGEAMICGLPVISTDCPTGPREMLAPSTAIPAQAMTNPEFAEFGVLMPMFQDHNFDFNVENWSNTIGALLDNEVLAQKYSSQSKIRMNDFSKENVFKKWEAIIDDF